jgi:phage baseplate assembly protein W
MAIRDLSKKPFIEDRDEKVFIGIDLPFRLSSGKEGYFASTSTTIESIKNNIRNLLNTNKGERLMQPNLGLNLRKYLFEQLDESLIVTIQNEIFDTLKFWLPFVEIKDLKILKDENRNQIIIDILFNITKNPNSLDSVQIEIGE